MREMNMKRATGFNLESACLEGRHSQNQPTDR